LYLSFREIPLASRKKEKRRKNGQASLPVYQATKKKEKGKSPSISPAYLSLTPIPAPEKKEKKKKGKGDEIHRDEPHGFGRKEDTLHPLLTSEFI